MGRLQLNFLPQDQAPSDDEILLQLVYGLCGAVCLDEERNALIDSRVGLPMRYLRRAVKLVAERCHLPVDSDRVDLWINWHTTNEAGVLTSEMIAMARELSNLPAAADGLIEEAEVATPDGAILRPQRRLSNEEAPQQACAGRR